MGLYINHLDSVRFSSERKLYIYLLSFGWPDGNWEQIFKKHFMKMADLASTQGAAIISSPGGVHFGNEVLDFHRVGHLDADRVLPAILITMTPPDYFREVGAGEREADGRLTDLLVVPLREFCTTEDEFLATVEKIFADLKNGLELKDFSVAAHDVSLARKVSSSSRAFARAGGALELKPNFCGIGVDLKKLFSGQ